MDTAELQGDSVSSLADEPFAELIDRKRPVLAAWKGETDR